MKHAYCIIAHQDSFCLKTLIRLLDFSKNDIYLLIDKKSPEDLTSGIECKEANLNIIPYNQRIDIRWGGLSQVKAELLLFKEAVSRGNYKFIHLLSGADLPLKCQTQIHEFYNSLPSGTNVVAFSYGEEIEKNLENKTRFYHPFIEFQRFRKDGNIFHAIQDFSAKSLRFLSVAIQKLSGFKRNWEMLDLKKGPQWISISQEFAQYLVSKENYILKKFRNVICPDEIFVQTMLYNSDFKETIYDYSGEKKSIIRKIDWTRGKPYTWSKEDLKELEESGALFARKFSSEKDRTLIEAIEKKINAGK